MIKTRISPCIWLDNQAEEAALFYVSIFKHSKIIDTVRYGKNRPEHLLKPEGSVMSITFVLDSVEFMAINGGPMFQLNEAVSFVVYCKTQEEIDYYWERLTEGGQEGPCGWLKDKFGVSWQVVPEALIELMRDPEKVDKVVAAFLPMKKLDIKALLEA